MANMGRPVNAAWLQPVSTDPSLLVNRDEELGRLVRYLEDLRESLACDAHILVSGARGVGKSIFTRAALDRFQRAHPDQAVCLTVDCRGLRYRPFLTSVASKLIAAIRPLAEKTRRTDLAVWLDQLNLFATYAEVTRAQTETIGRKYAADATIGADLVYKLQARFAWEETRSLGTTTQAKITVTDDLLHDAISETLAKLADRESSPWLVVIFFDDMDQAVLTDRADEVETLFRRVLALRSCISIVHFRSEAMIENVKREASEVIEVPSLSPDLLFEVVRRRLEASVEVVRGQFPPQTDWAAVRALAAVANGNALVFLRWAHGLLRTQGRLPPASDWTEHSSLEQIVRTAQPLAGADGQLVRRLVRVVDHCDQGSREVVVVREDLVRGARAGAPPGPDRLTEQEVDLLVKLNILLPKHRYQPSLGYRIEPVLDLLRPSVMNRLAALVPQAATAV